MNWFNRLTMTATSALLVSGALSAGVAVAQTYAVSEADRTINLHVEGSTFPNWAGTDQKRPFTLTGDELRYINTAPSVGSGSAEVVWRRVK